MDNVNLWIQKHVRIIYSPFRELLTSLHVLHNPVHHLTRLEWAEEIKKEIPNHLWEKIHFFGELSNEWLNFLDLEDYLLFEEKHVEEAIERLRLLSEKQFIAFLLGKRIHAKANEAEQKLLKKPNYYRNQLCDLLYDYHQKYFARALYRMEPWLIKSVHQLKKAIEADPFEAMNFIHPRFKLDQKSIRFYKAETWIFAYEEVETLTIYPSSFIAPHLLVGLEVPAIIVYLHVPFPNQQESKQDTIPVDLLSVLAALGDKTRLQLLKQMSQHPFCTQQLSESIGLAKATISKHLKILEKAELITGERHGHFVFYETNLPKLDQLKVDLNQFFDQPSLGQKEDT
ncbi:ArsR/SmtB family transcription factor [Niallia sp. JL1B1071]|uniref:ArsR/SmtB family transcription factor n=1 Tax=Niallia tiangongensis TaxID=3237105 RepID=UPI0037DDD590